MKHDFLQSAENYAVADRRKKRRHKIVTFLAAIVVFCTTYALILPAITMENECKIQEHTHTDECYTLVTEYSTAPVCGKDTLAVHEHKEDCRAEDGSFVCGYADFVVHTHNESCFNEDGTLWCTLPEKEAHTHNEECFAAAEAEAEHEHTPECYAAEKGNLVCQIPIQEAHMHGEGCFDSEGVLICGMADTEGHSHNDDCYELHGSLVCGFGTEPNEEQKPVCGKDEIILHTHELYISPEQPGCYDEHGNLVCGKQQIIEHIHDEHCFNEVEIPFDAENPVCDNTDAEHTHTERCYGKWELTCGMEEHTHTPECTAYYCGKEKHTHTEECYTADGSLSCGLDEHEHGEECLVQNDTDRHLKICIERIDALPEPEEVQARLNELANDDEGYTEYYAKIYDDVSAAYTCYEALEPEYQEKVTNRDKLFELRQMFPPAETYATATEANVYSVNAFDWNKNETSIIIRNETGGTIASANVGESAFLYWYSIKVEQKNGAFVVTEIIGDGKINKSNVAVPANGFVFLYHTGRLGKTLSVNVGDYVTLSSDFWKTNHAYTGTSYGTISFSSDVGTKADKQNKIDTIKGADTRAIIEVNLYDYGSNINTKYNSNTNYPGFQQDDGQKNATKPEHSNFGNNITADLAAGKSGVTQREILNINKVEGAGTYGAANVPISGAMSNKLINGYPALADGTSLGYLWGADSTYASKENTQSINGLFIYHEDTGAYTFDSRKNHAQYNSADDTFTLYKSVISSNFMWYPFGNFLPFNDIVTQCAKASTIDRAYLKTIANTAQAKGASGQGTEYTTLSTVLNKWIGLMDEAHGTAWGANEALKEYFIGTNSPFAGQTDLDVTKIPGIDLDNVYSIDFDEATDFYFGMEMKMKFMQPRSGITGKNNDQPMVFYFTGDDDVWVYVDDVLFLDLSGIHRHVGGKIDFEKGIVEYYYLDVKTGEVSNEPYKTVKFSEINGIDQSLLNEKGTFEDYTQHTFNFYYMERGAGSGVCRMNFNFPLLNKNSFSVTKKLSADANIEALGNPDFCFQVWRKDGQTLYINEGASYTIKNADGSDGGTGTVGANGIFKLKAGQTALFSEIEENAGEYFIKELISKEIAEQYGSVSVSGEATTSDYSGIVIGDDEFVGFSSTIENISDSTTAFVFNNKITTAKLGSISITKELKEYTQSAKEAKIFKFEVTLDGEPIAVGTKYSVGDTEKNVTERGIIELQAGKTATIANILAGTHWTVKETTESSGNYHVVYKYNGTESENAPSGVIPLENAISVIVVNEEKGASIEIPIEKALNAPDGNEHKYTFELAQVTDSSGTVSSDQSTHQSIELAVTDTPVNGSFKINYPQSGLGSLPAVFYYKVTERNDSVTDSTTTYDTTEYVVQVTVNSTDDGGFTASITNVWKNDIECTAGEKLAFVNSIVRYQLPATGGSGTTMYTLVGSVLFITALVLLKHNRKKRGKEAHNAS